MMRKRTPSSLLPVVITLGLVSAGCASGGGTPRPAGASATRIVRAELAELEATHPDTYRALERLRTNWLRQRVNTGRSGTPMVYVNDQRRGGVDELRNIRTDTVERMEFVSPADAGFSYGTGHEFGVIRVYLRR